MSRNAQRFEGLIDAIQGELNNRITRTALNFRNERPPDKKPVPEHVQVQQYTQVRDNPQAWTQIIGERGMKNALKYHEFGERLLAKWTKKTYEKLGMPTDDITPRKHNPALVEAISGQLAQMVQSKQEPMPVQQAQTPMAPPPQPDPAMGGEPL